MENINVFGFYKNAFAQLYDDRPSFKSLKPKLLSFSISGNGENEPSHPENHSFSYKTLFYSL